MLTREIVIVRCSEPSPRRGDMKTPGGHRRPESFLLLSYECGQSAAADYCSTFSSTG